MSMFPGPGAQIYYNSDGEPIGWDYPPDSDEVREWLREEAYEAYDRTPYEDDEEPEDEEC
jgi:hypothetical protein